MLDRPEAALPPRQSPGAPQFLYLAALSALWGSSFMFTKIALESLPPTTIVAGRIALAGAVLVCVLMARGLRLPRDPRTWLWFAMLGLTGTMLPFLLINLGQVHVDSGLAAIIVGATPMFTILLAHMMTLDERLTTRALGGVLTGFAGIVVLVGPAALGGLGGNLWAQLAIAGGALSYGLNNVLARRMRRMPPVVTATGVMICSTAMAVPASLAVDGYGIPAASAASLLAVAALGVLSTALGIILFYRLIGETSATFVSMTNYLVPIVGVVWGLALMAEHLAWNAFAALALILLGVAVVSRRH